MITAGRKSKLKHAKVCCLEAPSVRGLYRKDLIQSKRPRTLCEKQIDENRQPLKWKIVRTSFRALIGKQYSKTFIASGSIQAGSIENVMEQQFQECLENRCKRKVDGEHLQPVKRAVRLISIQMHVVDARDRVLKLQREYCRPLLRAGDDDVQSTKPYLAIQYIAKQLKPA